MSNLQKIFGVTGWKNSGKTWLVSKLVEEFTNRGMKVSTIKHAHHNFDVDHENTDSWKHRKSGAKEVALVSTKRWALMHELDNEPEPTLDEILNKMEPADLILIEGFKREGHPKIECIRPGLSKGDPIWTMDKNIIAIASDETPIDCALPTFDPNRISVIADFVLKNLQVVDQHG